MPKLKHTFKTDNLFKLLFTKNKHLLKILVARLLKIPVDSITQFDIESTEMTPDILGSKFCRLDILMMVDEQYVNLEIQVSDEGNFPERLLHYWARIYSNALSKGGDYKDLPRVIIIGIIDFNLFNDSTEFHSEYQLLETTRKTSLTDKQVIHFFELPKLPEKIDRDDLLQMWLALFKANTEEELQMIDEYGVDEINEVVTAYRKLSQSREFREMERIRDKIAMNEASALGNARRERDEHWQGVVAEKDASIAEKDAEIAELKARLKE